jgi:hypothetical protein
MADPLIDFEAYARIQTHPINLSPERGEAVEMVVVVNIIDRDDIRLVIASAT